MFLKKIFAFLLSSVVICESAFVDTLFKCSKDDGKCQIKLIKQIMDSIAETGVPELNIPPIDPVHLKNVNVTIPDVLDIIFDGVAKGVKNCNFNEFMPNIDKGVSTLNITCDLVVKGKYKVSSAGPIIKSLFGGESMHGEGNGKLKVEKVNLEMVMPIAVKKRGDDIFLHGKRKKVTYKFKILGGLHFQADNLYLGETESSATIVKLLNENWQLLEQAFGKHFVEVAIDFLFNFTDNFFNNVPTKHYFIEDLSSYVKTKA